MSDLDDFLGVQPPPDAATDAAVRTVYGEAANQPPEAQQAVISTAVNRANQSGHPLVAVLTSPGQYQAWQNPKLAAKMRALSPDDPQYQAIRDNIAPVLSGAVTTGYTHYLNRASTPAGSPALSTWAAKPGVQIGDQEFYGDPAQAAQSTPIDAFLGDAASAPTHGASASSAFLNAVGGDSPAPAPALASATPASAAFLAQIGGKGDGSVIVGDDGSPATAAQTAFYKDQVAKGMIKTDKAGHAIGEPGSRSVPYALSQGAPPPTNPGVYYVDLGGNLQRVPLTAQGQAAETAARGSENNANAGAATFNGLLQGFAPEVEGVGRALATGGQNLLAAAGVGKSAGYGMGDAYAAGANVAHEQLGNYATAHPIASGVATGAGSLMTAIPALEGGGALLTRAGVPALLGPTGEFLAGNAGKAALPEGAGVVPQVGNALLRSGSQIANAAVQGAGAGAVSTHLNPNDSIAHNMLMGATGGAALGTTGQLGRRAGNAVMALPGVGDAVRSFTEPLTTTGRDAIVNRAIQAFAGNGPTHVDASELVPGSTPTLATATGNRGLMAAEKALRGTPDGANVFGARDEANDAARRAYLSAVQGDNDSLAELHANRNAATSDLRNQAFASPQPTVASPAIQAIDDTLASPAGKVDSVAGPLQSIRAKLFNDDAGMSDADQRDLNNAVMRSMGSQDGAPVATTMKAARDRIGSVFDRVASGTNINVDDDLASRLTAIGADATSI